MCWRLVHSDQNPFDPLAITRPTHFATSNSINISKLTDCVLQVLFAFISLWNYALSTDYGGSSGSGAVILDDCNFHESVHLDSFDVDRTLTLVSNEPSFNCFIWHTYTVFLLNLMLNFAPVCQVPPDGEFPVMNYRMTQEFKPPFRINTLIEEAGSLKVDILSIQLHITT